MKPKPVSEQTINAFTPQQIAEREELHQRNVAAAHVGTESPPTTAYTTWAKYPSTNEKPGAN